MEHSQLQLGLLVPLEEIDGSGTSGRNITLFEGYNSIGRNDLAINSKHVSRKHISIHASNDGTFQVTVEGQNPIVLRTESARKEIKPQEKRVVHIGDVLEFLPGKYPFKLTGYSGKSWASAMSSEENGLSLKRKRQELMDETLARALQDMEDGPAQNSYDHASGPRSSWQNNAITNNDSTPCSTSESNLKGATQGCNPSTFQLFKVRGLPNWANAGCVGIQDVIEGDIEFAILSNYMIDIEWLLSACPNLQKIPNVVIVHGESGGSLEMLKAGKPPRWLLHKPPLPISYGTHHSKAMLLIYQTGIRVIVHTANLIYVDWNNKTQGLWMQDFPYKEVGNGTTSPFEEDLIDYLQALQWNGCSVTLQRSKNTQINAQFFRGFDYSSAKVRLIASVPGYHQTHKLKKWGHMKLRAVLDEHRFEEEFKNSPLVYQFSSLGSLNEKWLAEFTTSTSAGRTSQNQPLGLGKFHVLWPTVEDVRCSIEGYGAGNAIPSPFKNVEKDFLKNYWGKWQADHSGRSRAMPHFKSYLRYSGQDMAWFLLTSANLSQAAWGALQKNGSQLMIRSYELGVLFLPSLQSAQTNFSCTNRNVKHVENKVTISMKDRKTIKFATTCYEKGKNEQQKCNKLFFPVPYKIPPKHYGPEDVPWSWDRQYSKPDVFGETWPRAIKLYGMKE